MQIETINKTIKEIGRLYSDKRLYVCEINVDTLENGRCVLTGLVLDEDTKTAVTSKLAKQYPDIAFDPAAIRVLQQNRPAWRTVTTNLAGFHGRPSRTSELLSEIRSGGIVEYLDSDEEWVFVRQEDGYLGWLHHAYARERGPSRHGHSPGCRASRLFICPPGN